MKKAVIIHEDKLLKVKMIATLKRLNYKVENYNTLSAWHRVKADHTPCDLFIINTQLKKGRR